MAVVEIERALEPITKDDLGELYEGSVKPLRKYFLTDQCRS